jgi:hypothetical protein
MRASYKTGAMKSGSCLAGGAGALESSRFSLRGTSFPPPNPPPLPTPAGVGRGALIRLLRAGDASTKRTVATAAGGRTFLTKGRSKRRGLWHANDGGRHAACREREGEELARVSLCASRYWQAQPPAVACCSGAVDYDRLPRGRGEQVRNATSRAVEAQPETRSQIKAPLSAPGGGQRGAGGGEWGERRCPAREKLQEKPIPTALSTNATEPFKSPSRS